MPTAEKGENCYSKLISEPKCHKSMPTVGRRGKKMANLMKRLKCHNSSLNTASNSRRILQQYVAESETSTQLRGRTRSFLPLGQSCFCRERLKTTKEVKLVFPLGSGAFPGVLRQQRRVVGGLLLLWEVCCSQGNRTGQTATKNKPPICL